VLVTVSKENTLLGPKLKLVLAVWAKVELTGTPKDSKSKIVWLGLE
jgi:hypothetical protein